MSIESWNFSKKESFTKQLLSPLFGNNFPQHKRKIHFPEDTLLSQYSLSKLEAKKVNRNQMAYKLDYKLWSLISEKESLNEKIKKIEHSLKYINKYEELLKNPEELAQYYAKRADKTVAFNKQDFEQKLKAEKSSQMSQLADKKWELQQVEKQLNNHPKYKEYQVLQQKYEKQKQETLQHSYKQYLMLWLDKLIKKRTQTEQKQSVRQK